MQHYPEKGVRLFEVLPQKWVWAEAAVPFIVLCLLFGVFAIGVPNYLSVVNLQQLMRDFAEPGLVAIAMAVVILAGGIDLSVGATFALANFAALYFFRIHGLPLELAVLGTLTVGLLIGAINGVLVAYINAQAFLTTLAMLLILRASYDLMTNAYILEIASAMLTSTTWDFLGVGALLGVPVNMAALVAVGVLTHIFLTRTRPGLHLMAVGANRKAARHAGVDVQRTLFLAYTLSGLIAALAGLFYAARQNSAGSDAGQGWELTALTAVIVGGISLTGGRGTIARAIIGAAILFILSSGLLRMNIPGDLNSALTGLILLLAVALNLQWIKNKVKTV
ncbi:MAG: ABC transporter permease [Gammaproteobacteria bacterium]